MVSFFDGVIIFSSPYSLMYHLQSNGLIISSHLSIEWPNLHDHLQLYVSSCGTSSSETTLGIGRQQQEGSPDIATVGVRKPRSGSVRKPRSGAQTVVTFDQDIAVSPLTGSPAKTNLWNEGTNFPARDSDTMHTQFGDAPFLSQSEKVRDSFKNTGELRAHSQSSRMEGEERTELRMFQRRERKREDEKGYTRDASRSGLKGWKDSDAPFGREEIRRSGSPSYEVAKKAKDSSERFDRTWRDRESSERRYHRERDDYVSGSSWHKNKGSQDRDKSEHSWVDRDYKERPDYSIKDRAHRDRIDPPYTSHKDWKSKGHSRDKEYERGDRVHDAKDNSYKSRSVNVVVEATERHSNQQTHGGFAPHRSDRSSHMHDRESPSIHKHVASGRSSQGEHLQSESFSRSKSTGGSSSSYHEERGAVKGAEPSNVTPGGDSRSIPKLKLKVGGITHTLNSDGKRQPEGGDPVSRTPQQSGSLHKKRSLSEPEPNRRRQRLILQEDSDDEDDMPPSSKERAQASDEDRFLAYLAEEPAYSRGSGVVAFDNTQNLQGVRKSSRVPKKRVFDGDDDVEVEPKRKRKKKVEVDSDEELYRIEEDELDHGFAEEEEELELVNDAKLKFTKRRRKSLDTDLSGVDDRRSLSSAAKVGSVSDSRGVLPLTARQRALQSSKEGLADVGSSLVEFPEGLTHAAPKKQKEVLTAAERQLKKEEAAQKRRQQVEKAAKEIQAVAIQKILCQDSQRKKREGKLQKQREEMEQEKKAAAMAPASNSIRWVLGPNGTVVSFSQDVELPKIFSGPLSYPQERERCAGPSCTNAYKYRDSKTLLPLCSLQCYRAVQRKPSEAGILAGLSLLEFGFKSGTLGLGVVGALLYRRHKHFIHTLGVLELGTSLKEVCEEHMHYITRFGMPYIEDEEAISGFG
ncbi:hypothetical protein GOP47_0007079 [Adiantum capillus-veneris]|uniref:INO80 complex subunit B-like conserved region domain-containing protein n=1 Tax=Adiantum capillus-veneris TaxID=13818 RepID=A0A9D4V0N0_ADICA|nr:hypothetical protein GOP47_0007079 [Adiantum capillus-veneris]